MKMCQLLKSKNKNQYYLGIICIILFIFLAGTKNFSVEEKRIHGFPTFAIYTNKIPIYATLSGSFTFYPEKEIAKVETYNKNAGESDKVDTGSSYLSIKYENKVYKFHDLQNIKSEWNLEESSIHLIGKIPDANVKIFIVLKNKNNRPNSFFVSYGAINHSDRIVDIGFRSLIDIGNEANDGIPLKICTDSTHEKEIYSNEFKFTPFQSSYWETYNESELNSIIGFRNHLTGQDNNPPDQIAFVNWERAFGTEWNYFTNKDITTNTDSAVLLWWNPRPVKQGEKMEVFTEYEIKGKYTGISFDLLDPETGSGRLHIRAINDSNTRKEAIYQLNAGEKGILSLNFDNPIKFLLEKNSVMDKIIPVMIHGNGDINFSVKENFGNLVTHFTIPLKLVKNSREQCPKFWKSSKYPIIYNSDKDGLKLRGVVRAKDTGKKLGETQLISVKSMQNMYVYLGEVDTKEYNGEVIVEILKQ